MNTFAISFYLKYDESYVERYNSLFDNIVSYQTVWAETPSMIIVETDDDIDTVESKLRDSLFDPETDILVVIEVSRQDSRASGSIRDIDTLGRLLPGVYP